VRIEDLAVNLRTRTPWEASDLGLVMLRQWWRPTLAVWLVIYVPCALLLTTAFHDRPWIAFVALWWLKPLFDRFVLHVLSRAVFGELPSVASTFRAWRDILSVGLWMDLTFHRIGMRRSFYLPIKQLEGMTAKARTARMGVLGRRVGAHALAITIACLHFEVIAAIGIETFVAYMLPDDPGHTEFNFFAWLAGAADGKLIEPLDILYYALAVSLIEPLYVAQGFGLYLTRRTHLEGWDLELGLRRIANRLGGIAAALLLVALVTMLPVRESIAEDTTLHDAKTKINEILAAPAFEDHREVTEWRWRGAKPEQTKPREPWKIPFLDTLAALLRSVAWLVAAAIVIAVLWYGRRFVQPPGAGRRPRHQPIESAFSLDVRPDSLPPDVPKAARDLINQHRFAEALSLLYRGALSVLIFRFQVTVAPGDTERECAAAARAALPTGGANMFEELVRAWQQCAYAEHLPAKQECERLVEGWVTHFASAATTKPSDAIAAVAPA
jgi:Domain of unknown function (DUF4129)